MASKPTDGSTTASRNLRWNFGAAVIDAGGWGVGMSLVSATTILPLFVSKLTDSPLAVGMIQAVMLFGWLLPGILVSGWVEALPRVKRAQKKARQRKALVRILRAQIVPNSLPTPT